MLASWRKMIRSDTPRVEVDGSKPEVVGPDAGKPEAGPGEHITLKVVDTERRRFHYTMRRTDTLHGLMDFYYATVSGVSYGSGEFRLDGHRVRGCQTAAELQLEDGDEVQFSGGEVARRKPATRPRPAVFITLKVVDTEGREVVFRTMRRTDTLHGLMDMYYASAPDVSYGSGEFSFDGDVLRGCQTAAELRMKDGDTIHFFPDHDQCLKFRQQELQIYVRTIEGRTVSCRMRRMDTVQVLMDQFIDMVYGDMPPATVARTREESRFIFAGRQLDDGRVTPARVGLKDDSTVHHMFRLRGS